MTIDQRLAKLERKCRLFESGFTQEMCTGYGVEQPIGEFALYGKGKGHKRAWIALRPNELVYGHEDMVRAAVALAQGVGDGGKQSVYDFQGVSLGVEHVAERGLLVITRMSRSLLGKPTKHSDIEIVVSAIEKIVSGKSTSWTATVLSSEEAASKRLQDMAKPQSPPDPRMAPPPKILSRERKGRVLLSKEEVDEKRR
jgi:hypothetical protein